MRYASADDSSIPIGVPQYLPAALTRYLPAWAETLLLEESNGSIHPWLAASWDIRADESRVIFNLRDDVYFHDGSKFNAEVAKWNIDLMIETRIMNPAVTGANVLDEYTLEVTLAGFTNAVLPIFASHSFCFISMEYFLEHGEEHARLNPVGSGAFTVLEQNRGQSIIYVRNDNYWIPDRPFLDRVEFVQMTDVMTQSAAVMSPNPNDRVDVLMSNNP
jgi:peptide/nickel transport system substrate-binding protein